ncbi:head-tail connector protein [Enterococcus gallinarum]|nr:head-tail connector protein [Enterococcus gallinarum]
MNTLEGIKSSLRIDHDLDNQLILQLIDTASDYIKSAIDSEVQEEVLEEYKQFDWSVSLLVQHWYLNRQEASSERMPITVQSLIQQMRGAYYATH